MLERRIDYVLALTVDCALAFWEHFGEAEAKRYLIDKRVPEEIIARIVNGNCEPRQIDFTSRCSKHKPSL